MLWDFKLSMNVQKYPINVKPKNVVLFAKEKIV